MNKLTVTLQDTESDRYKRMFEAACVDLGRINACLGLDPDDGGAEPIIEAIKELRASVGAAIYRICKLVGIDDLQEPEIAMIDAAMVEMANIHPPLKRSECQRLIRAALSAAPAPQAQEPVLGTKTWFDGEKLITQNLTASDIYAEPAPVDREMCMARENAVLRVALREVQDASNWAYGAIADKLGEAK